MTVFEGEKCISVYKVGEVAKITGVKEGTIRFYEKCGFLKEVARQTNGYRIYDDQHIFQVMVCDRVFDSFVNSRIRKSSMKIIEAARDWDPEAYRKALTEYRAAIQADIDRTKKAIGIALNRKPQQKDDGTRYSKKQAAELVGTTPEAIRNWERNGLIPQAKAYSKRYFNKSVLERMFVIRLLLDNGYGIMAILKFLRKMDEGDPKQAEKELTDPKGEDLQSKADYYLKALNKVLDDAEELENLAFAHHLLI